MKVKTGIVVFLAVFLLFSVNGFAAKPDDVLVSGIMYDETSSGSRAIVNGMIVKAGDKAGDAEIISIRPDGVVVRIGTVEREIGLNNPGEGSSSKPAQGKAKSGFWVGLKEWLSSFGRKRADTSAKMTSQEHYLKAMDLYQQAENSTYNKERVELYQSAVKYAQYSLDIELPDAGKAGQLRNIIEDSRAKGSRLSEKLNKGREMDRLFIEGRKYMEIARNLSSSEASLRSKKKDNYSLALQYFNQAYGMAEDGYDKRKIEDKITAVEAALEAME